MSSVIETLANKKKTQVAPVTVVLPVLQGDQEAECGDGCGCGEHGEGGGCCGG